MTFFGKFIGLYEENTVGAFCEKNSRMCAGNFTEDVSIETSLVNTIIEDDDDFDFDLDYDLQTHNPVVELDKEPRKELILTTNEAPSTRLDNSLKAMTTPAAGKKPLGHP